MSLNACPGTHPHRGTCGVRRARKKKNGLVTQLNSHCPSEKNQKSNCIFEGRKQYEQRMGDDTIWEAEGEKWGRGDKNWA